MDGAREFHHRLNAIFPPRSHRRGVARCVEYETFETNELELNSSVAADEMKSIASHKGATDIRWRG